MSTFLAGCVALPAVDADIARANLTANQAGAIELMRQQDERIAHVPFVGGNAVELLRNGPATYAAMTEAITAARRRIDMESYIFEGDEAVRFADLLLAKRKEGVEVNLIYDAWGSLDTPASLFERLRRGGVRVVEYNPIKPGDILDVNRRDHRKLLVVDAAVTILGGVNISEVYDNRHRPRRKTDDPDEMVWRDTDIRIQGPVSAEFERMFLATWIRQHGPALPPPPATPTTRYGDERVQAIGGDPNRERPLIYRTLIVALALARTSIHLTTGFFAPTPDLAEALEEAARRGVSVAIVVPSHSDSSLAISAGRAQYAELMEAGVHIYERQGVVLHAKTAVIDGAWSAVGSSNLDWRSVIYNEESDAIILGREFGQQMETLFRSDVAASIEIDPRKWADRPLGERLDEWGASVLQFLL